MHRKKLSLLIVGLAFVLARPAASAPFSATFTLELGSFPPFMASASGTLPGVASGASAVANGFTFPAGAFPVFATTPVSPPVDLALGIIFLTKLTLTATNLSGSFTPAGGTAGVSPGGLGGNMPFAGQALLNLMFINGNKALGVVPLTTTGGGVALGAPGSIMAALITGLPITVFGQGWTTGTVSILSVPIGTTPPTTVTRMGSVATTPNGFAKISLVTPTRVTVPGSLPATIPAFGTLTLRILPEPGGALLFASLGLAMFACWRRR